MTAANALVTALAAILMGSAVAGAAEPAPAACAELVATHGHELDLFGEAGTPLAGGARVDTAPAVEPDRLVAVALPPQAEVAFAHAPGKPRLEDGARATLLRFAAPAGGRWRVTIDDGAWIDVVRDGALVVSNSFQGRSGCTRFHKSVEYTFDADKTVIVQISGSTAATVRLAITPVR